MDRFCFSTISGSEKNGDKRKRAQPSDPVTGDVHARSDVAGTRLIT